MNTRAVKPFLPPPIKGQNQPSMIVDGSPLAIIGIFVEILQERFAPGNGLDNYPWYEDQNQSKIVIASDFEDNVTERNKKPAIFVDKDQSVYGKIVIGDRAGYTIKDGKDFQWTLSSVPVLIDCVSDKRGESAKIGDIVQWSLHAASDVIQSTFAFHDMTPVTLGRTGPYEADKEAFSTPVTFNIQYNVRWTTVPIRALLQEIALRIEKTGTSPTDYFVDIALRE